MYTIITRWLQAILTRWILTRFNSQYHLNLATELTCRFSPLARLRSILTVLCVSTLLLMLCIRKALTVTIGQFGGSNSNTYTQTEFREAMKQHSISEIITVAPFPVHVDYMWILYSVKTFGNLSDQCTGYVVHMYAYMRAYRSMLPVLHQSLRHVRWAKLEQVWSMAPEICKANTYTAFNNTIISCIACWVCNLYSPSRVKTMVASQIANKIDSTFSSAATKFPNYRRN